MKQKTKKTPVDYEALQRLNEKILEFNAVEAEWIDSLVREIYPGWVTWLAELSMRRPFRWIQKLIARYSGLEILREQDVDPYKKKGFRKGSIHMKSVTTRVIRKGLFNKKKETQVGEKKFNLNIVVRGDLKEVLTSLDKQQYVGR